MSADLLQELRTAGIALMRTAEGKLRAQANQGVMTDEHKALIAAHKDELLAALEHEQSALITRRRDVLAMLDENPDVRYAWLTDASAHPDRVIVALAIRGVASCELSIARHRYDPQKLLELIDGSHAS